MEGSARASGEETLTDVHRTEGGGMSATAKATSTGGGGGQMHAEYHSVHSHGVSALEAMSTHDLKAYCEHKGADLTGAIERGDLLDIARKLEGKA